MKRYSDEYVDKLLSQENYDALVELQGMVYGWSGYNAEHPTYGLPESIFMFVEALTWFAQAVRSGVWTYFEVTSKERQTAMKNALASFGATKYSEQYSLGSAEWHDPIKMKQLDEWMNTLDDFNTEWLFRYLRRHRFEFAPIYA